MYPLSDKDLDRMSREASEQNDVDLSPSGWERLEKQLNKELPTKKDKDRKRFLWFFFLTIAISGAGLVFLSKGESKSDITKSVSTTEQASIQKETVKEEETYNQPDGTTKEKNVSKPVNPVNDDAVITPAPSGGDPEVTVSADASVKSESLSDKKTNQVPRNSNSVVAASIKKSVRHNNVIPKDADLSSISSRKFKQAKDRKEKSLELNSSVTRDNSSVFNKISENKKEEKEVAVEVNQNSEDKEKLSQKDSVKEEKTVINEKNSPSLNQPTDKKDSLETTIKQEITSPKKDKASVKGSNKNRFAFGIIAGTDFSNINGQLKTKAGYSFGLQVSYNITKRLSVNSGFLFTKKFYEGKGSDFNPPKHYFTYYVDKLLSVDGNCFMWEIPVNIRFDLVSKSKFNWYLNSGVSSYIMRKQAYRYDYIYNGNPASRDWSTKSQQNEWLKIINLSTGIEYSFNKKWSVLAEPYLKLPTTGIGFGKMDISSFGLIGGLRYRPNFKH